jgi:hypothetical protein
VLDNVGEILVALGLVLFSVLFWWLVWSLRGLAKQPKTTGQYGTMTTDRTHRRV